jgi:membrane-associated phospholipid phosphatase
MSRPAAPPTTMTWTPFVLLGLLTFATLGSPLAIFLTLKGGQRPAWPPDRPLEWWTFGIAISTYLVLLTVCLTVGIVRWRRTVAVLDARREEPRGARP